VASCRQTHWLALRPWEGEGGAFWRVECPRCAERADVSLMYVCLFYLCMYALNRVTERSAHEPISKCGIRQSKLSGASQRSVPKKARYEVVSGSVQSHAYFFRRSRDCRGPDVALLLRRGIPQVQRSRSKTTRRTSERLSCDRNEASTIVRAKRGDYLCKGTRKHSVPPISNYAQPCICA